MNDQSHSRAVRLQSIAVIFAALVTTGGAVTSALIQTGWVGKPSAPSVAIHQAGAMPRVASFIGTIEPHEDSPPAAAPTFAATAEPPASIAPAPATLSAMTVSKPLMGVSKSWFPTVSPAAHNQPANSNAAQKPFDWQAVPRLFQAR